MAARVYCDFPCGVVWWRDFDHLPASL